MTAATTTEYPVIARSTPFAAGDYYEFRIAPSPDYPGKWRTELRHIKGERASDWESALQGNLLTEQICRNRFAAGEIWRYGRGEYEILDADIKRQMDEGLAIRAAAVAKETAEREEAERVRNEEYTARRRLNGALGERIKLLKGRKGTVALTVTRQDRPDTIDVAATIYDERGEASALAIHRRLDYDAKRRPGYTVTHIATGQSVGNPLDTLDRARVFVALLLDGVDFDAFAPGRRRGKQAATAAGIAAIEAAHRTASAYFRV